MEWFIRSRIPISPNKIESHLKFTGWWFQTCFIFTYIWNNHPNWRTHIFQDGYCTTKQFRFPWISWILWRFNLMDPIKFSIILKLILRFNYWITLMKNNWNCTNRFPEFSSGVQFQFFSWIYSIYSCMNNYTFTIDPLLNHYSPRHTMNIILIHTIHPY
jgi:hypothetical protein